MRKNRVFEGKVQKLFTKGCYYSTQYMNDESINTGF